MEIRLLFLNFSFAGGTRVNRLGLWRKLWLCLPLLLASTTVVRAADANSDALERWLDELDRAVPAEAEKFAATDSQRIEKAADAVEQWAVFISRFDRLNAAQTVQTLRRLLAGKQRVDRRLDATLEVRRQFAALDASETRQEALRAFLETASRLIDLSGRLRYLQVDAMHSSLRRLNQGSREFAQLVDLLIAYKSSVGATILSQQLLPQPADDPQPPRRTPLGIRIRANRPVLAAQNASSARKLLELAATAGDQTLLGTLSQLLDSGLLSGDLTIAVAETIRQIGLPQQPRPGTPDGPEIPPITPRKLYGHVSRVSGSQLSAGLAARRNELLGWLEVLMREGITGNRYRIGGFEVQAGDWLLMRNPSPYNLFTDLSPGLFTHVGVAAIEEGSDGIRRMVLVDLPERGSSIPATNVETYLARTLHFCFLRHPDAEVAAAMGQAAADVIGNESQFDLNFRTDRVLALKDEPLPQKKVHTYCAGLLLLCAIKTPAPRTDFFPIPEFPAGGRTVDNLAKLGLSIGDDFISPTGAIFSPKLEIVGRREPMYDPKREIEEAIFDHFAELLETQTLVPSPDLFQSLRLKMAEASKSNPLLAQALAKAAKVNVETDLVAAAKAAAVVETLDDIAYSCSDDFLDARDLLMAGPIESLAAEGYSREDLDVARQYFRRHADLYQQLRNNSLSPRQLRVSLVKYYSELGEHELEHRFFKQAEQ